MNGRTCQLCGKPLSRIRVGAGGDFCSREHRNQHRLRCGMDRLMEANQMASLMRRREHLKPLNAMDAHSAAAAHRRPFSEPAPWKPAGTPFARRVAPRLHARMRASGDYARFRPGDGAGTQRRIEPAPARNRRRAPMLRTRAGQVRRAQLRASVALLRYHVLDCEGNRRLFGPVLRTFRRPLAFTQRTPNLAAPKVHATRVTRGFLVLARKGRDIRVSASQAFRIPRPLLPRPAFQAQLDVVMSWPGILPVRSRIPVAAPGYRPGGVTIPVSEIVLPAAPPAHTPIGLPGLATLVSRPVNAASGHRVGQSPFVVQDPLWFRGSAGQEDDEV